MNKEVNPFDNVTKMIEQFKLPGVDMSAIVEARRKDIEAVVEANKAAHDAMQALASKLTEMLTQAMQGIQEAAKGAAAEVGGLADPTKQAELARKACQNALADMKELADMARKSQSDAMASITQRATQNMAEIKKMMQPK
ncbi:MAG: TIGR01841 family phasin [Polaromonas sp.]